MLHRTIRAAAPTRTARRRGEKCHQQGVLYHELRLAYAPDTSLATGVMACVQELGCLDDPLWSRAPQIGWSALETHVYNNVTVTIFARMFVSIQSAKTKTWTTCPRMLNQPIAGAASNGAPLEAQHPVPYLRDASSSLEIVLVPDQG